MNHPDSVHCPRLIEIAMPIREVSAESVRQKSAQRGHISTLHIWWARRPIAASRAVVFASVIPDPDDPRCPAAFRRAVERLLKTDVPRELRQRRQGRNWIQDHDPYAPYANIEDTLRNRLLAFIAKWSPEYLEFQAGRLPDPPRSAQLLDDRSLIKWETTDPESDQGRAVIQIARELVRASCPGPAPTILDPFAGGGAIPLEASRLGCSAIANEYDPVAYLVLRATCEYPRTFGKSGIRSVPVIALGQEIAETRNVDNVLAFDFERWARWVIDRTRSEVTELYNRPSSNGNAVLGYYWVRIVHCVNPSCGGEIPLLRNLLLCTKETKRVALGLNVDTTHRTISFHILRGRDICETQGPKRQRGSAICPHCNQPNTEANLRTAAIAGHLTERLVAVIEQNKEKEKVYRLPDSSDVAAFEAANRIDVDIPQEYIVPEINGPSASRRAGSHRSINLELYGITRWGQLFNRRQLVLLQTLVRHVREAISSIEREAEDETYAKALATYLGLWLSRSSARYCAVTIWHTGEEKFEHPFGRQSVPMTWDYAEVNPFTEGSAGLRSSLKQMLRVIERESSHSGEVDVLLGSADSLQLAAGSVDCVVTDPPYGNSIAYADLADYFYVWLKRTLADTMPDVFSTPQTPKAKEATSHKHRHEGSQERANAHYQQVLTESFREARRVSKPPHILAVMFAHQTTEAWSALLSALNTAGFSPNATWPIDTELTTALKGGLSALSSSVTVVCRPRVVGAAESFRNVKNEIERVVHESVQRFWSYGFRGADLIVACYGPAVGVFGKFERVEKADGTVVGIPELLELARRSARDAIAGGFRGDNVSTLYYVWANLYATSDQAWDDARLVAQVGGESDDAMDLARGEGIFVVEGSRVRLALLADRKGRKGLGADPSAPLIDVLHRAMLLWQEERRAELVAYLLTRGFFDDGAVFWKLAQALFEVLPRDSDDWKLVSALLSERQSLTMEAKRSTAQAAQRQLFAE